MTSLGELLKSKKNERENLYNNICQFVKEGIIEKISNGRSSYNLDRRFYLNEDDCINLEKWLKTEEKLTNVKVHRNLSVIGEVTVLVTW